eukprot:5315799-Pleurochrysis_carterae.AAC.1
MTLNHMEITSMPPIRSRSLSQAPVNHSVKLVHAGETMNLPVNHAHAAPSPTRWVITRRRTTCNS